MFDYRVPRLDEADIGCRVRVPFGRKTVLGVIVGVSETPSVDPEKVRAAGEILRDIPPLPQDLLQLLEFCSGYYHHPIGEVIHAAMPGRLRLPNKSRAFAQPVHLTPEGRDALRAGLGRARSMQHLLTRIHAGGALDPERIRELGPSARRLLKRAMDNAWVVPVSDEARPDLCPELPAGVVAELTAEQRCALQAITSAPAGFCCWLLYGVTGSGKTEVYLESMRSVLAAGKQVLFLVPEIGLTPQLEHRIRQHFPQHALVTLHSSLPAGQRASHWTQAHCGSARIVLGARSAVFSPLPRLGLIVVDEEHDASFKQADGIRYSARDLAIWRARQHGIPVILGSATPSLESYQAALLGRYRLARLTRRASAMPLPEIRTVAVDQEGARGGLASSVIDAIHTHIDRGEQVLVFINRRGYAPVLVCAACGWALGCHRCSARLVLHKPRMRMSCHHCGHEEPVPKACAQCGNADLHPLGYGTQRVENSLRAHFPAARILRVDRDTTRGRNSWSEMRSRIERREVDILIGTQLLSKGHDFPGLGLVCVLNADQSLYSTDFRAAEQLFAQLTQVAGRAGRAHSRGQVLIQTGFPFHPLYQAVQAQDYETFARSLLDERRQTELPPFVYQAVLRAEAVELQRALAFLQRSVEAAHGMATDVTVFDPAPAVMQRLKGRERAQLLVQSTSRLKLHGFLDLWLPRLLEMRAVRVRWALDVDPLQI